MVDLGRFGIMSMADDIAYDQRCLHGCRVDGHAVYCDYPKGPRKCCRSWYYGHEEAVRMGVNDEACPYYVPNPAFKKGKIPGRCPIDN